MPQTYAAALLLALVALPCIQARGQVSLATNAGAPLSTRVVAYDIDAAIDTQRKSLDATETLTYRNLTGQALSSFPFHLYLNAFQPDSTFTSETHFGGGVRDADAGDTYPEEKRGSIVVSHAEADGFGDLTAQMRYAAPDDGNPHDRTVAWLTLPRALAAGESVTFRMRFQDRFPESVARNGYRRDFLMGGQWFPKVGVFWHGAWNCHQYHATTEFFSDFGTYHVALTLPRNYTVGASGVPVGDRLNGNGTRTLSFYGEDIHDFAWAASPHFNVSSATYLSALGPVQIRVLALAAHPTFGKRYRDVLLASMKQFEARYGPYPYKILTLVDPEPDSEIGGMEYPTLVTGGASWLLRGTHELEETAEHEFGHQYWYGMVATNEFEDAWLDEGINSYTEAEILGSLYGRRTSIFGLPWANLSDFSEQYLFYLSATNFDPVTRHAWQFHDAASYGGVTYGKSSVLLKTLAGLMGQETMDEAMRVYFQRFRFTHPDTEDFLRTIEEVAVAHGRATAVFGLPGGPGVASPAEVAMRPPIQPRVMIGSSLRTFFEQAVYGTRVLDYAVDGIRSGPAQWWLPKRDNGQFLDAVTVHRVGDFVLPVTLEVVFTDGSRVREHWDGGADANDRWKTFTYQRGVEIASAEIDPDHLVALDVDAFNNSRTARSNPVPARKLTGLWMAAQQLGSQLAGWLV